MTKSEFDITFAGKVVLAKGDVYTDEDISFPLDFPSEVTPLVDRDAPRLDSTGNVNGTFSVTVRKRFRRPVDAVADFVAMLDTWTEDTKGTLCLACGDQSISFEAVLTSFRPRIVVSNPLHMLVEYSFSTGKRL